MRKPAETPAAPSPGDDKALKPDGGTVPDRGTGGTGEQAEQQPAAAPAPAGGDDDETMLELGGVSFSKVQRRDVFMAYKDDDHIGVVSKPKGEKRWRVEIDGYTGPGITFSNSVAARVFILGFVEGSRVSA